MEEQQAGGPKSNTVCRAVIPEALVHHICSNQYISKGEHKFIKHFSPSHIKQNYILSTRLKKIKGTLFNQSQLNLWDIDCVS